MSTISTTNENEEQERFTDEHEEGIAIASFHRDLLEVIRGAFRLLPDRWDLCSARVQEDTIDRASQALDKASRAAVRTLAGHVRASVDVEIDSVKFGEKIVIQCTAAKGERYRHEIADAAKHGALLVLPDYPTRHTRASDAHEPARDPSKDPNTGDMFEGGTAATGADPNGGTGPFEGAATDEPRTESTDGVATGESATLPVDGDDPLPEFVGSSSTAEQDDGAGDAEFA